jgi:ComF family protein
MATTPQQQEGDGPAAARMVAGWLRGGLSAGWHGFGRLAAPLVSLVYPPVCMACGGAVGEPATLCAGCWRNVAFIQRPFCERLGVPFAVDSGPGLLSPLAIADPPVFERARSVAAYDGAARDLVHRLKYNDRLDLAAGMARLMAQAGGELMQDCALIIPVPLHWARAWGRRGNQAAELGAALSRFTGLPQEVGVLRRRKRTRTQVGLTRDQRRDNLQGAFHVPPEQRPVLAGRRVLLVDDVLTTGATANACARVLLRAGASAVDVLTFARVVKPL